MVKKVVFLLVFGVFSLNLKAQVRKYSNEFLSIGVGAKGLGMANASVASVDDVTSGYWNPSGLLRINGNVQVGLMHSEYFAGIAKYDYAAFGAKIDSSSALGVSVLRFGVDNIPNTTELIDANGNTNYDRISTFSAADYGFLLSYARKSTIPGLSLGANAKIIRRLVGDFANAWGFGLDVGIQYEKENWRFGCMGKDITSTFNAWSFDLTDRMKEVFILTENEIPDNSLEITLPRLILGASRKFVMKDKYYILPEFNTELTFDGKRNVLLKSKFLNADPRLGVEIGFWGFGFFRAGIGNYQVYTDLIGNKVKSIQPNLGLGIKFNHFYIDYALTDIGDNSVALYSHVFALKYEIFKQNR